MALTETALYAFHLVFASLWTGSVLFAAYAVVPLGRAGDASPGVLAAVAGKLSLVNRLSSALMLLSGLGLWVVLDYTSRFPDDPSSHLVLTMVVLWVVLTGLVEVGVARLTDASDSGKVRTPAENARPFLLGAALVGVLLLLDAAALAGNLV
ncbi:transporter [Salarchaeum sp. JOR-1]|uniref:transporter n=1 Tax=Salarchaeum sp. JOR-1 TaxID=2599399 RepID=UPI001198C4AB|nr:transporter [Salarchaeum sp. JOR-1]QDX41354.1 transporter [Salarchaeum sp. JOR-1]